MKDDEPDAICEWCGKMLHEFQPRVGEMHSGCWHEAAAEYNRERAIDDRTPAPTAKENGK